MSMRRTRNIGIRVTVCYLGVYGGFELVAGLSCTNYAWH